MLFAAIAQASEAAESLSDERSIEA